MVFINSINQTNYLNINEFKISNIDSNDYLFFLFNNYEILEEIRNTNLQFINHEIDSTLERSKISL